MCGSPTSSAGASSCSPEWQGDGYCDDVNNNPECDYDGGDVSLSLTWHTVHALSTRNKLCHDTQQGALLKANVLGFSLDIFRVKSIPLAGLWCKANMHGDDGGRGVGHHCSRLVPTDNPRPRTPFLRSACPFRRKVLLVHLRKHPTLRLQQQWHQLPGPGLL